MKSAIFSCGLFLICIVTNAVADDINEYRIVETNTGQIRGIRKTSMLKKTDFYSFKGIPYAKAPIGHLRFKVSLLHCCSFFLTFFRDRSFQPIRV